jgi:hypothetical protein
MLEDLQAGITPSAHPSDGDGHGSETRTSKTQRP